MATPSTTRDRNPPEPSRPERGSEGPDERSDPGLTPPGTAPTPGYLPAEGRPMDDAEIGADGSTHDEPKTAGG